MMLMYYKMYGVLKYKYLLNIEYSDHVFREHWRSITKCCLLRFNKVVGRGIFMVETCRVQNEWLG